MISFDKTRSHVWQASSIPQDLWISFPGWTNHPAIKNKSLKRNLIKHPISFDQYRVVFDSVLKEINRGNSYLTNLTFPTPVTLNIGFEEIYHNSRSKYTMKFRDEFIVFSPEPFVRIRDNKIFTTPMKGTINAALPGARDLLLNDKKEESEHYTIVDLMRNDLRLIAKNIKVEKFRYVEEVKSEYYNLLQTSSLISGDLPEDYRKTLGDRIFSILPAGSVSGAPKRETLKILKENERYERGFYTGVMGYFDGKNMDSAVMIRFLEKTREGLVYKSGGGITAQSDALSEYQELIDKVYVSVY